MSDQPSEELVALSGFGMIVMFLVFMWGIYKFTMWQMEPSAPPTPVPTQHERDAHALQEEAKKYEKKR